jgi:alpha-tubulin suppressor-like RCC1 family protein/outer membrane protein OmpA-like peptidoglycan-associated protein
MRNKRISTRLLAGIALFGLFVGTSAVTGLPVQSPERANALTTMNNVGYSPMLILAGDKHMCWRDMGNGLLCSGDNTLGQLGTANNTSLLFGKSIKTSHMSNPANLNSMGGGNNHICVVTSTGTPSGVIYCSGDNTYGQLGDGTNINRNQPTAVADSGSFVNSGVSDVWAGGNSTCAMKSGILYCWGRNDQGQLGDGTTTDRNLPTPVAAPFNTANSVMNSGGFAMGDSHSCATSFTGSYGLYCWGDNAYGQIGDGTTTDRLVPTAVSNMNNTQGRRAAAVSAGTTCAVGVGSVSNRDAVKCWGLNDVGQVGDGTTTNRSTPTFVTGAFTNDAQAVGMNVAGGGKTMCAHVDRSLYCWGNNASNQITSAATTNYTSATLIAAVGAFTNSGFLYNDAIAVSSSITNGFACYGRYCWGDNTWGQLSQNNTTAAPSAVNIKTGTVTADSVAAPSIVSAVFASNPNKIVVRVSGLLSGASVNITATPADVAQGVQLMSTRATPTITNGEATVDVMSISGFVFGGFGPPTNVNYTIDSTKQYTVRATQTGNTSANVSYPDGFESPSTSAFTVTGGTTASIGSSPSTPASTPASSTPIASSPSTPSASTPVATIGNYATAIPGVTVTDAKVYTKAPVKVSADSAINAMTPAEAKTFDIVSRTPSVCLPNDDDLVFLDDGRCIATIVNEKTRKVLRTLKTTVVETDISELKVGNEVVVLSPLYFSAGSAVMKSTSAKRLTGLAVTAKAAGSILIAGHSGNLMGNTPENQALSRKRAAAVVVALKKLGTTAPIAIAAVGALDPESRKSTQAAQDKNRRAVVVLIP